MSFEIIIFIDYDNLLRNQQERGILDVVTNVLIQSDFPLDTERASCFVRLYGGWYEGTDITRKAENLSVEIQREFPKVIRIPAEDSKHIKIQTTAELAVSLLQEPNHHIFNTFRRKGMPRNIRVETKSNLGCTDGDCFLPTITKLLKNGKCPKDNCCVDTTVIYRSEQKLVDTMLSCDLLFAAISSYQSIFLISNDDDFIPPLRSAILQGARPIRVSPKINNRNSYNLNSENINFDEMEL